ncbi:MAG: sugar phosphate isomerase/epimerase [Thermomicrobiales bacterium]
MKIGVFAVLFGEKPLGEALDYIKSAGCGAVEIGCGHYPGKAHCDPAALLADEAALAAFRNEFESRGLEISALSCHGNVLHPDPAVAQADDQNFRETIELASRLGVQNVINFSGCPGDSEHSTKPNWVTCPWPPDFLEILEWQWNDVAAPYWSEIGALAKSKGVRIAIELHPGFLAYHTDSFLRLRAIGGDAIGVNFDPSHLFWQGMDPLVCARELGDAIFHVHMKDTWLDKPNIARTGVLDTKPYTLEKERSWIFRTVGYGHGQEFWRALISELRLAGYDGALSIEHEDSILSINEGFTRAVDFLADSVLTEDRTTPWWA